MRYCMTNHFCALVNDITVVVVIKCAVPLHGGHVQNQFCNVMRFCIANHLLCFCVYDCVCDTDHKSAIKNYYYYNYNHGRWKDFSRGATRGFFEERVKSGEICCFHSKLKKYMLIFLPKIAKSNWARPLASLF